MVLSREGAARRAVGLGRHDTSSRIALETTPVMPVAWGDPDGAASESLGERVPAAAAGRPPAHRFSLRSARGMNGAMRSARAKVVKGKIVTRTKFPDGTKLLLLVDEPQPEVELDEDDQKALDDAIAATRQGKLISWETLRASLLG